MRRDQAGMTLVEVSIAAVVLAMLLTGLVTAMRSLRSPMVLLKV